MVLIAVNFTAEGRPDILCVFVVVDVVPVFLNKTCFPQTGDTIR